MRIVGNLWQGFKFGKSVMLCKLQFETSQYFYVEVLTSAKNPQVHSYS